MTHDMTRMINLFISENKLLQIVGPFGESTKTRSMSKSVWKPTKRDLNAHILPFLQISCYDKFRFAIFLTKNSQDGIF